jgi:uncharacterized membrane protein
MEQNKRFIKIIGIVLILAAIAMAAFGMAEKSRPEITLPEPAATTTSPSVIVSTSSTSTSTSTPHTVPVPIKVTSGIKGIVLLGPICPVMRNPPEPGCDDRPYKVSLEVTNADGTRIVARFASNADGKFVVNVSPGEYAIRSASAVNMLPRCGSNGVIIVKNGTYTNADVSCDTGIR